MLVVPNFTGSNGSRVAYMTELALDMRSSYLADLFADIRESSKIAWWSARIGPSLRAIADLNARLDAMGACSGDHDGPCLSELPIA